MSSREILRSPASAALLVDLAAEHGMSHDDSLSATRLTRTALDDLDTTVTVRDELKVITNIVERLGDLTGLGIEAGSRCHATTPGIWGLALISCGTLREAISVGLPLVGLSFALSRIDVVSDGDAQRLCLDVRDIPIAVRRFVVERDLAGIRSLQREVLMMPNSTVAVHLSFSEPQHPQKYVAAFGEMPTFGAAENSISLRKELLDQPLPRANDHTRTFAEKAANALLQQRSARGGVAGVVRELMLANPNQTLTLDDAGRRLTLSARTLRRRLADEGVSMRTLQEEVREAIAEELLITERLPVAEIADRLGYSEVSSFTQAFRRWKGVGPREYRQSMARK